MDDPRTAKITIRELLNQTSGISDETLREKSLPQPHSLQAAEQLARVPTPGRGTWHPSPLHEHGCRRPRRDTQRRSPGAPATEYDRGRCTTVRIVARTIRFNPQLVRLVTSEFAVDEIGYGRSLMLGTRTLVSRKYFHTSISHQHFDAAVSHRNTVTKGEFSVNSAGTVGAMRGGMNLDEQLRKPGMSQ